MNDKEALILELRKGGYIKSAAVRKAFDKVDRKNFVRPEEAARAYFNQPLSIGFGQTISQPLTVAFMLELLGVSAGDKVLDVGAGSGWQTALLAELVGEKGRVVGVERIPELADFALGNIRKYPELAERIVLITADASRGVPKKYLPAGGFDRIIAAAAAEEIPEKWKEQLRVGGRIVAPVGPVRSRDTLRVLATSNGIGQSVVRIDKLSADEFKKEEFFGFAFVPLIEE